MTELAHPHQPLGLPPTSSSGPEASGPNATGKVGTGPKIPRPLRSFGRLLSVTALQVGEMIVLLGQVIREAVRRPVGYWSDVLEQMYDILRLCFLPMMVSLTTFGWDAPGVVGGSLYNLFGMPERLGSFFIMASVREFAPFINMMIVAGVMGTAVAADLGARRIREEIDAMEVLGIDPIRTLILPRVIAFTIMTALLNIVALTFGVLGGVIAEIQLRGNILAFLDSFWANATSTEMWTSVAKSALYGLIIGLVCCYKGYRAQGGPVGVGRAVNQAVVISFAGVWMVHFVMTKLILGLNPDMIVYK
jgi:phospholipid/cholesterol/gamma-HCH transport system permease protein